MRSEWTAAGGRITAALPLPLRARLLQGPPSQQLWTSDDQKQALINSTHGHSSGAEPINGPRVRTRSAGVIAAHGLVELVAESGAGFQ
jgi:hypothetical protein